AKPMNCGRVGEAATNWDRGGEAYELRSGWGSRYQLGSARRSRYELRSGWGSRYQLGSGRRSRYELRSGWEAAANWDRGEQRRDELMQFG
ncbi:MAG TPA: hypothetical protein VL907_02890, partial [Pyrinomonadaceae bacterium]|nr:hypothetical protein [Pyrinomonadaceae bacterium]